MRAIACINAQGTAFAKERKTTDQSKGSAHDFNHVP